MFKKTNKLSKTDIELEFEVLAKDFNIFIERAIKELSQDLEIKGFRKGNVPIEIAKEQLNKEAILSKAAEKAAQKEYNEYLLENDPQVISQPELNVLKLAENNDFLFKIKITLLPEVILPDYKSIAKKVESEKVEIKEQEIKQTLDWLQRTRAKKSAKQGPAEKGDFVEIEYSSVQIGEQKDAFLLGEGKLIPGFEENIIGMEAGEVKKEVRIKVPVNNKNKEIAGKEMVFQIKLKSVFKMEIPELSDEFAISLGKFKNLQELKSNIQKGIEEEKKEGEKQRKRAEILNKISEKTEIEIPTILIEKEQKTLIINLKEQVKNKLNLAFEDYLKQIKKTEQEVLDSLNQEAEKRVKQVLILKKIAEQEKIDVSEQEVKEEADKMLKQYQDEKQVDIDPEKLKSYTKEAIKSEKVLQLLENI